MRSLRDLLGHYDLHNKIEVAPAVVAPSDCRHAALISALAARVCDGHLSRQAFSPFLVPPACLPHIALVDIVAGRDGPNSYRYRLFGTEMREVVGLELTGKTVADYPKRSCRCYLTRLFDECRLQGRPLISKARLLYPRGFEITTEKTFLPLFGSADAVDMILTLFTFNFHHGGAAPGVAEEPEEVRESYRVFEDMQALAAAIPVQDPVDPQPRRATVRI